ncbi:adenine phosphoribosyltransferase [Alicyclobacillus fastidiosus]|uniref:Adenine phosphoribosyltransferase n=1 Tax=Alicyclobacillus fastidiosus TaxID=392011 RepID=A0ABY6ZRI6_9BACL|nr:adenine phosphoribosyltransferase [Alicyclobacillus fastidiosus]WAH44570.1 adenine phosphoribosyltransferase [Alicyclobacillus fastidiosus]
MDFRNLIRDIPDFPKKGILFRDITPLLADGPAYKAAIEQLGEQAKAWGAEVIVGPEARGYVVGAPLSYALEVGFVPVRKRGKLPSTTVSVTYDLEYGQDMLEIHTDAIKPGQKVVLADDLLATGGTMAATIELVEKLGGIVVGAAFFIELLPLNGREKLGNIPVRTLVQYED